MLLRAGGSDVVSNRAIYRPLIDMIFPWFVG